MPGPDWLFDPQGRMRQDLPPLLYPNGHGNALAPQPPTNNLGQAMDIIDRLGLEIQPDGLGGWSVKPKRWSNPGRDPFYGLMLRRSFNALSGGNR